ncbi:MAG TPA: copper resistance system multicopper oxidase [Candidatus Binataceae bacterium]|nr:copper resistance system multicopper oxidase [Candidatus Binataceae bacterium]
MSSETRIGRSGSATYGSGGTNSGGITRRRFVQGVLAGGVVASLDLWRWPASAAVNAADPPTLSGNSFNLIVEQVPVNYTGRPAYATAVNGSVPGPTLRWREGDTVTLAVSNRLKDTSSIHWHGIRTPSDMDGVPGLGFPGIPPGETFVYRFPVRQSGTYWYHSHSRFQEQTGQYGALIIEPQDKHPVDYDREYVVVLSDWTDTDPEVLFSNLKQQSDYYNFHQPTVGTFLSDARTKGLGATTAERLRWGRMNMSPNDILDVSGATYTYLINGQPPATNWTGVFRPHERVRLRFINASSMSIFDVRIPGLPMAIVQTDGNDVEPIEVDELRISVAETYDAIVQPRDARAYTIFAQAEDRTGYARGTLAPAYGMSAEIPAMDPRPQRTMIDMGMQMFGMGNMSAPVMEMGDMSGMPGMEMGNMPGMSMQPANAEVRVASRAPMTGENAPGQPGPRTSAAVVGPDLGDSKAPLAQNVKARPGPQVDNVAAMPTNRLARPGEGFPPGRRVLAYSDLRAVYRGTDPRPPAREIELHLTGNMQRFIWGFNGEKFSDAEPIRLQLGERVRIILVNDTMMEHPIHLHGLWSELENGNGEFRPYKHTLNVKGGERLSFLVSADTPGQWAFHCHLLYHMEAGMFRAVIVS